MSGELNQWIWDTMFSMTLLMLLVLAIRKSVSHFFGARIAYLLWILPLARLFMPILTLEAPAQPAQVEPIAAYVPATAGSDMIATMPVQSSAFTALASLDWMMIALILWLGGAGMLFISKLASYMQFREDIVADGQLIGRHGNIKILETAAVGGPLAFGLFEKYIAVPTNFFRDYAPRERELALEHEIAHHESGDLAANFIGLSILSLHWFNPVAWYAWIAFRQDQETACDARVLAQSGRDVRAVYGRTIAKSASGHRLGLASPLNQKDKIKGRLKMLGQSEKSTFRRRLGAGLIALGTVAALPLTATVTYAEAVDPVDISAPDAPLAPEAPSAPIAPSAPVAPSAPLAPSAPAADGDETRITMLTDRNLAQQEIRQLVAEAEQSRIEADRAAREHRFDSESMRSTMREVEREIAQAEREMRLELQAAEQDVRKALQDAREARREALRNAREAQREAREAEREARNSSHAATRLSSISYSTSARVNGPDCIAMNRQIAMAGEKGLAGQAWAVVAGCGGFEVKIDKAAILDAALQGLKKERAEAEKCNDNPAEKAKRLKILDREIKKITTQHAMI